MLSRVDVDDLMISDRYDSTIIDRQFRELTTLNERKFDIKELIKSDIDLVFYDLKIPDYFNRNEVIEAFRNYFLKKVEEDELIKDINKAIEKGDRIKFKKYFLD